MVEVMKIMATSFKRCLEDPATISAQNPAAGHHQPTPPAETPGHPWASLGQSPVGHCSFLWALVCTRFSCALQESVSPVLWMFWRLCGGLMVNFSKRAYAIPRSTAPRVHVPVSVHC